LHSRIPSGSYSRPKTPAIEDDEYSRHCSTEDDEYSHHRSTEDEESHHRRSIPAIEDDNYGSRNPTRITASTASRHQEQSNEKYEKLIIKQGKQIRALYELQKLVLEKVAWVESHLRKQNNDNKIDLSQKVFNVSKIISLIILLILLSVTLSVLRYLPSYIRMDIMKSVLNSFRQKCGLLLTNTNVASKSG
jgi:hypothetical protein